MLFLFQIIYFLSISLFGTSITQWMVFQFVPHSFIFYLPSVIKITLPLSLKLNFLLSWLSLYLNFTYFIGISVLWMGEELVQTSQLDTGMELEDFNFLQFYEKDSLTVCISSKSCVLIWKPVCVVGHIPPAVLSSNKAQIQEEIW